MSNNNIWIWAFVNSAFGIWFLTTVVGGGAIWSFEKYLNAREHRLLLSERAERIDLEIEARIAQYASWVDSIVEKKGLNRTDTEFIECVTNEYLHFSIKALGAAPTQFTSSSFSSHDFNGCPDMFLPSKMFPELADTPLIGLLAERISSSKNLGSERSTFGWVNAINPFLTPDSLTGVEIGEDKSLCYKRFHESVSKYLYGFPRPAIFHYGDCFRC